LKELPKIYEPNDVEIRLIEFWEKNKFFAPESDSAKPRYSIVIPPPNVTGNLTVGHMLNNTVQDVYARWKRMSGYNVLWLPGTDHAGISTQTVVEKKLKEEKISRHDLGREKFVEKVWEWKEVYHANIKKQLIRMGASVDWSRERFTFDEVLSKAVRKVFVELYKKGLIYKGKRIINWDPEQQTALSDEEVNYIEKSDKLYYIKYPIADDTDKFVVIATTRPETMLGDTAVAVNPKDERYSGVAGKKILLPLVEKAIPIIQDEYVDMEFGTGALKVTPAHDPNDFELGGKYGLETVQVIDHSGKMNELAGKFSGLDRFEARKQIVDKLKELDLVVKIEDYVHNVGVSERGGAQVEPYLSDQWFVSMKPLAESALNAVVSGEITFHPERWTKTYVHWMNNIRDWCISRQLWWGHQIPVWYNKNNGERYCEVDPPKDIENWEQDPDVLDTWFSSWLWPFSTMGWPEETEDLKKYYPTDFLSTAPDIIFFWVARMIMASLEFTGKIPFRDVYFHNVIRDIRGRKMSKSLGNSPDVIEVMEEYGTDALRFTLVYLAPQGTDVMYSNEKCELGRNFANKLWNAARFLLMKKDQSGDTFKEYSEDDFDKWIKSRLHDTIRDYLKALEEYKINEASKALYDFIWRDYCDWYIEILKIKAIEHPDSAGKIFADAIAIFEDALKLLNPVMPFITEEIWRGLGERAENDSITISSMPEFDKSYLAPAEEQNVALIQEMITAIRNLKTELKYAGVKGNVEVMAESKASVKMINENLHYITKLTKTAGVKVVLKSDTEAAQKQNWVHAIVDKYEIFIEREASFNSAEEKKKLEEEINKLKSFIETINKKLGNDSFVSKAPPKVIESERKKLADQQERLDKLVAQLDSIN
jgi:valyl-tRNA synthetase